ncbi:SHOCT domain-containing protein [uncultured Methanobrevibacter sp.]|uniref:SHOCT domain-containing protein n=1 Tax=uncultured Methanobrevibacter sp. TaxID=253161 RepID=UPI0025D78F20|nr:SHOCT domain-containing protein [uncultured Methanobrevibacter sp.]
MVKCKNCGAEIGDASFCFSCGEKVESGITGPNICPKCGTKNPKGTTFCVECGQKFENALLPESIARKQKEWELRRQEIIERYDLLAEEFGIKDEDYFLTSVVRVNMLEEKTTKHKVLGPVGSSGGNKTTIDGFFLIEDDKFVFMEIDNRDMKKVNAGITNFYFDKIVSMRITKRLGDTSRYEDITKRTSLNSAHAIKRAIQNDIQSLKATRFKDLIVNNDSADMFDRLLIKLVDNTSFEIRLPGFEFGQNLVALFKTSRKSPQTVVIQNDSKSSKADLLKKYKELLDSGAITEEEFNELKNEILSS